MGRKHDEPVTEAESATLLQGRLDQAAAENVALQARNTQLAGYQSQAQEANAANAALQLQIRSLTDERDQAVRDANAANARANDKAAVAGANAKHLAHAEALAKAVQGLLS